MKKPTPSCASAVQGDRGLFSLTFLLGTLTSLSLSQVTGVGSFTSSSTSGSLITVTPSPAQSLPCSPRAGSFQGLEEDGLHFQHQADSREGQWLIQREI